MKRFLNYDENEVLYIFFLKWFSEPPVLGSQSLANCCQNMPSWCLGSRTHGDLVSGLYHQILLSLQKVLSDPVRPLCSHYGAVVGLHALGWKVNSTPGGIFNASINNPAFVSLIELFFFFLGREVF